ncbi:polysaccharide deacetylase familiy protein [Collibacillus ludicampi]|uniref:Polysaccharide deacetylase familiy protein n=1 Tax=Collibacillus ludicampi TaxID=2771369 RepID=A0AAV4LC22_9BACL|nr:polysaccharide deacetylase family protein [Collibacillus ludicampi]GIM45301.1 polysaccharide deacetylase familiy protein [Collibacillus ludicampi]
MWMAILAVGLIMIYAAYTVVADLLFHYLHLGVIWRGSRFRREVALTFDDGPDPRYTEPLLELLQQYGARATFFLVGERALQYPELVRKIVAAGHEIGVHGMHHDHAWLLTPRQSWVEAEQATTVLEQIIGRKLNLFRPPWGTFNWSTYISGRRLGLKPVLWDVTARDWVPNQHPDTIKERLLKDVRNGSIVLCHDAGGAPDAPRNTLAALREVLPIWEKLGFKLIPVSELIGNQERNLDQTTETVQTPTKIRWSIRIWRVWEFFFDLLFRVRIINDTFRVSRVTWHGKALCWNGMTIAQKGTQAMELHFQNLSLHRIAQNENLAAVATKSIKQVRSGLPDIARLLQFDPCYRDVQVVFGITILYRGAELLGFHVEDLPPGFKRAVLGWYMRLMLMIYHPLGLRRLRHDQRLKPKLVWASREDIIARYLTE